MPPVNLNVFSKWTIKFDPSTNQQLVRSATGQAYLDSDDNDEIKLAKLRRHASRVHFA